MREEIKRKPKLTAQEVEYCLLHMLRNQDLFNYAKQHLRPEHFNSSSEMAYSVLWASALAAAERCDGKLPEKMGTIVAMELESRLNACRDEINTPTLNKIQEVHNWIFMQPDDRLDPTFYRALVQDLIIERTIVGEMSREMTSFRDVGRPLNIIDSLQGYSQKLQSIMVNPKEVGKTAFPRNFKPKKLGKFSTGLKWLDDFMNGGQAPGEVYVILGPTGLGKTTQAIMLAIETANVWNAALINKVIERPKVSCFFSWEQDHDRLMLRFWSYAARIDSTRLERYADEQVQLSTRGNLEPYELELFANEIKAAGGVDQMEGEAERLEIAGASLNDTVRIFDFSGSADNPHVGEGGLDEVAAVLRTVQQEGFDIGTVIIDYANAAVRKYMAARGEDQKNIRHHLSSYCNEARFKIGIPFNCPVWILNQLNTEANRRAPTAEQHHSFASECGNFAENAWFAFVFSTKDKVNNTCRLYCTKERRAKGDMPPLILKIDGNLCKLTDASNTHAADVVNKQYMLKETRNRRVSVGDARERQEKIRAGTSDIMNM